jgi:flavin-dependent dehydrogenase
LTPIRGASPIGHRVSRAAGPGWMLVGDAAGFIDPFTGEGIFRALRSARAAAEALEHGDEGAEARYLLARRQAFSAKDALTWLVQGMLASPPLMGYALRRLASRPATAERLGSALGDCRPASDALSPLFLAQVLRP